MSEAKAVGYLELNVAGFDQAISTAKKALVGLGAAFAAFKTADFWKEGIEGAIHFGNEMYNAGQKLGGFDPGKLLIAQKALENAGLGAEEARGKMNEFLDSGRNISDIFKGSDNYAAALQNAAKSYGSQADVLSASSEKLAKVFETIQAVSSKVKTFFLAMTAQFVDPLSAALEYLNQIDLAGVGEAFGKNIAKAANILVGLFKNGDVYEALKLGMEIAFKGGINYLVGGIVYSCEIFEKLVQNIFTADFFTAVVNGFSGVGQKITAVLLRAFATPIEYLQAGLQFAIEKAMAGLAKIPGVSKALGLQGFKADSFDQIHKDIKADNWARNTANSFDSMGSESLSAARAPLKSAIKSLFSDMKSIGFKPSEVFKLDKLEASFGKIIKGAEMVGEKAIGTTGSKIKINQQALQTSTPFSIIASSLAKVGGGGGFLRTGQNLLERESVKQTRVQEQMNKELQALNKKNPTGGVLKN